jgi:hypothetical protein
MMRFSSLFILASPFVFGQGVFGQWKWNSAIKWNSDINDNSEEEEEEEEEQSTDSYVNGNYAFGQQKGNDSYLKNEGSNGSLNTRFNDETIENKNMRLIGEVPADSFAPIYDPVLDAVCLTDPAYSPTVSNSKALYDDFVKIFDFGFKVS